MDFPFGLLQVPVSTVLSFVQLRYHSHVYSFLLFLFVGWYQTPRPTGERFPSLSPDLRSSSLSPLLGLSLVVTPACR